MPPTIASSRRLLALASCLALSSWVISPGQAVAEDAEAWDASAVQAIAEKLPEATEKLYTAIYQQGEATGGFGLGNADYGFKDSVRLLHEESLHFAAELKKGKGMAETKPVIERIKELNDDAKEYSARRFSERPENARFSAVEDLVEQLERYYGL